MLICDKRRPRTRGDTNIRPPQGGRIKTAPPASGPRLGRSSAWGGTPPGPPGLRPLARLRAPGPCCLGSPSRRGSGHGCAGGGGGQPLAVVHARRLAPGGFRASGEISKAGPCRGTAGGFGGRAPRVGRRWATRPRRWAARVQPQAVPAVHGLGEVVHGRPGSGRSGSSEQSNRANIFSFAQPTRAKPRQYWVSREPLYKKIGDPDCTTLCNLTTKMQSKQHLSTF